MKRSIQEIVELVVFAVIALLVATGVHLARRLAYQLGGAPFHVARRGALVAASLDYPYCRNPCSGVRAL